MKRPAQDQGGEDRLLSTREAAEYLGVSIQTIRLLGDRRVLPQGRTSGNHRRYRESDLRAFAEARASGTPAHATARAGAWAKAATEVLRVAEQDLGAEWGAPFREARETLREAIKRTP